MISERIFKLLDIDKDGYLNAAEFVNGTMRLFSNLFDDNAKLIFDIFDFDGNGVVSKEDFRTLLSHIPLLHVLDHLKLHISKEGQYTRSGGGM